MGFEPGDSNRNSVLHSFPLRLLDKSSSKKCPSSSYLSPFSVHDAVNWRQTSPVGWRPRSLPSTTHRNKPGKNRNGRRRIQSRRRTSEQKTQKQGLTQVRERTTTTQAGRRTIGSQVSERKEVIKRKSWYQFRSSETFYTSAACLKNLSCLVRYVRAKHHQLLLKHDRVIIRPLF